MLLLLGHVWTFGNSCFYFSVLTGCKGSLRLCQYSSNTIPYLAGNYPSTGGSRFSVNPKKKYRVILFQINQVLMMAMWLNRPRPKTCFYALLWNLKKPDFLFPSANSTLDFPEEQKNPHFHITKLTWHVACQNHHLTTIITEKEEIICHFCLWKLLHHCVLWTLVQKMVGIFKRNFQNVIGWVKIWENPIWRLFFHGRNVTVVPWTKTHVLHFHLILAASEGRAVIPSHAVLVLIETTILFCAFNLSPEGYSSWAGSVLRWVLFYVWQFSQIYFHKLGVRSCQVFANCFV